MLEPTQPALRQASFIGGEVCHKAYQVVAVVSYNAGRVITPLDVRWTSKTAPELGGTPETRLTGFGDWIQGKQQTILILAIGILVVVF